MARLNLRFIVALPLRQCPLLFTLLKGQKRRQEAQL
jgi:hypothetical protein